MTTNSNIKEIKSRDGRTYWIEAGDTLYESRFQAGSWQKRNLDYASTLIDNWTRCLDVGSNMACSAVLYADVFQTVECFEPTPLNIDLWKLTINANNITNCVLHEVGVGEREYTTEIVTHERNGGHNHLSNSDRPRWTGKKWAEREQKPRQRVCVPVDVKTIDSFNFQDVGFIKLDIEGYEKFALEGAIDTITRCRPTLQLEIRANQCRKFGYWAEDMIDWIRSLGYTVMSKNTGEMDGTFKSHRNELLYNGEVMRREMDIFFQPNERMRHSQFKTLFEQV
jgi:FkbM family methyltransferase